ncbi:hypothetical protein TNCV_2235711 [Trichonephila clavipes]|nr:hypothetical protein TNCV_2235711 [Trichonephila clavipes]
MGETVNSKTTPNYDTRYRTSAAMHNATVKEPFTTVFPNLIPTIVMLQAEAELISQHNIVPFRCYPCMSFIETLSVQMPVGFSQGLTKQWTPCGHSILLQMASNGTRGHRSMRKRLVLL